MSIIMNDPLHRLLMVLSPTLWCLNIADYILFANGGSMSLSGMSFTSLGASLLRMVSKCIFHSFVCFSTHVTTTSLIGMTLFTKKTN